MKIEIRDHRVVVDGKPCAYRATPNQSGTIRPEGVILHDTGALNAEGSIAWLCNPEAKASAHVVISRDGVITQLAPLNAKCWHAGVSRWNGRANVNGFAIGIEISNPGKLAKTAAGYVNDIKVKVGAKEDVQHVATPQHGDGFWLAYTPAQVAAVTALCRAIAATYGVKFISTHYEIAPGRKIDVNPRFPLAQVRHDTFAPADAGEDREDDPPTPDLSAMPGARIVPTSEPPKPAAADPAVLAVQARLRELGYYEVGDPDGGVNGTRRTEGAILAFRNDNGLPLIPGIDDDLIAALRTASPRPIAPARAEATVKDLRDKGSETILFTDKVKACAAWLLGIFGIGGTVSQGGDQIDNLTNGVAKVGALKGTLDSVGIGFGAVAIVVLCGGAVWLVAHLVAQRRLRDHRTGKKL